MHDVVTGNAQAGSLCYGLERSIRSRIWPQGDFGFVAVLGFRVVQEALQHVDGSFGVLAHQAQRPRGVDAGARLRAVQQSGQRVGGAQLVADFAQYAGGGLGFLFALYLDQQDAQRGRGFGIQPPQRIGASRPGGERRFVLEQFLQCRDGGLGEFAQPAQRDGGFFANRLQRIVQRPDQDLKCLRADVRPDLAERGGGIAADRGDAGLDKRQQFGHGDLCFGTDRSQHPACPVLRVKILVVQELDHQRHRRFRFPPKAKQGIHQRRPSGVQVAGP
jgi:hypothetical protein